MPKKIGVAATAPFGADVHEQVARTQDVAGPVWASEGGRIGAESEFETGAEDDAGAVLVRAAEEAGDLLEAVLEQPEPMFVPQREDGVTYAEKIGPSDRVLDLDDPEQAVRVVRALSPHIGARAKLHGRDVLVWRARVGDDGTFVPLEVQPAGKRRMAYDEFLRGVR